MTSFNLLGPGPEKKLGSGSADGCQEGEDGGAGKKYLSPRRSASEGATGCLSIHTHSRRSKQTKMPIPLSESSQFAIALEAGAECPDRDGDAQQEGVGGKPLHTMRERMQRSNAVGF